MSSNRPACSLAVLTLVLLGSCGGGAAGVDSGAQPDSTVPLDSSDVDSGTGVPGLGDRCTPEASPTGGFSSREVYVESNSTTCLTRVCMVYHLGGDPRCPSDCAQCDMAGSAACPECMPDVDGNYHCVVSGDPELPHSAERMFCTCRCGPGGNPSLPLCECADGFRCVPESDPGGGFCVPDAVALSSEPVICESDEECSGSTCDLSTQHCL